MAHDDQQNTTLSPTLGDDLAQMSVNLTEDHFMNRSTFIDDSFLCITGTQAMFLTHGSDIQTIAGSAIDAPLWIPAGSIEKIWDVCELNFNHAQSTITR